MKNPHQLETYLFLILDHPKKSTVKLKFFDSLKKQTTTEKHLRTYKLQLFSFNYNF